MVGEDLNSGKESIGENRGREKRRSVSRKQSRAALYRRE